MPGKDENKYRARNNNQEKNDQNNQNDQSNKNNKNDQNDKNEANKKAVKTAAKAAGTYLAGPAGGKAVDAISKTKLGDQALNKGAQALDRIPGVSKTTKKLNDNGTLDKADKAIDIVGGDPSSAAGDGLKGMGSSGAKNSLSSGASSDNKSLSSGLKDKFNPLNNKKGNVLGGNNQSEDDDQGEGEAKPSSGISASGLANILKKNPVLLFYVGIFSFCFIMSMGFWLIISSANEDHKGGMGGEVADSEEYDDSTSSSCIYRIKGVTNGQSTVSFNKEVSNIKVRLMHSSFCDGSDNVPIEGEELVDFEKYILGVVYAEISGGSNEAHAQTQAVAARSFIFDRAIRGGNKSQGVKLVKEKGQWILQVRNCVADQVYCDPDKGCSKNGAPKNQNLDVYSGTTTASTRYKSPLPKNAKSRKWVAATAGEVAVNSKGYIVGTNYAQTRQDQWASLGQSLDYKQILIQQYGAVKSIAQMNCTTSTKRVSGDYASWKQYGESWSSIKLGNSSHTIKSAGCLVTSISMLIKKSGVATSVDGEFNPGTFVKKLNNSSGFSGANLQWGRVSVAAPNFVYQGNVNILNLSKSEKLDKIKSLLNQGYYVTAEVKGNTGQHWVAIDSVSGSNVTMMDPGSTATSMWDQYNYKNTSRLAYFKAT